MKHPEIHDLIGLFYTHTEAANILGIHRNTYARQFSIKQPAYHSYMRILTRQVIKDINHAKHENPRKAAHYDHLARAILEAARKSFRIADISQPRDEN